MKVATAVLLLVAGCAHQARLVEQRAEEKHEERKEQEQQHQVEQLGERREAGVLQLVLPAGTLLPGNVRLSVPTPARMHFAARTAASTTTTDTARQSEAQAAQKVTAASTTSSSTRVGPPWWAWLLVGVGCAAVGMLAPRLLPLVRRLLP